MAAAQRRLAELGASDRKISRSIYGVDVDVEASALGEASAWLDLDSANFLARDFFSVESGELPALEAVVGNPPYIRYQSFNGSAAIARELAAAAGVELSRLASSWAPFVVHGTSFIAPGGRLAQVLPGELLHAQYARPVIEFLRREFGQIRLAVFDERVFPGALEDVVLLFAEDRGAAGLAEVRLMSCSTVADVEQGLAASDLLPSATDASLGHGDLLSQLLPRKLLIYIARYRTTSKFKR